MNEKEPENLRKQTAETSPSAGEDRRLMQRVRSGEPGAWAELIEKYYRPIYWMLFNLIKNSSWRAKADEAEDLCQDTWSKVLRRAETYDETKPLSPWVRAIALHSFYDWIEKQNRQPSQFAVLPGSDEDNELEFADTGRSHDEVQSEQEAAQESLDRVMKYLERKKPKIAVLFHLTRLLQLSPMESREAIRVVTALSQTEQQRVFARANNEFGLDASRVARVYLAGELTHEDACRLVIIGGARAKNAREFDPGILAELSAADNKEISDAVRKVNDELVRLFQTGLEEVNQES